MCDKAVEISTHMVKNKKTSQRREVNTNDELSLFSIEKYTFVYPSVATCP